MSNRPIHDLGAWSGIFGCSREFFKYSKRDQFAPEDALLGRIKLGSATAKRAWGEDGLVLYIAASTAIYLIHISTRGANF